MTRDESMDLFALLPDELALAIVFAVGDARATTRLAQTCRRMHVLAFDASVWKTLCVNLCGGPPPHERFGEFGRDWRWVYRAQLPLARRNRKKAGSVGMAKGDDRVCRGDFSRWRLHGYGHASWTTADGGFTYDGQWRRGKMHGRGTYTWPCGSRYQGDMAHNVRCGYGVVVCPDGVIYSGEWSDDVYHGRGVLVYRDGSVYDGEWFNGDRHGVGTYVWPDGDMHYHGGWVGDDRHGRGVQTYEDGTVYDGEWVGGKRHRQGTFTSCAGTVYQGAWADGKVDGHGIAMPSGGVPHAAHYEHRVETPTRTITPTPVTSLPSTGLPTSAGPMGIDGWATVPLERAHQLLPDPRVRFAAIALIDFAAGLDLGAILTNEAIQCLYKRL